MVKTPPLDFLCNYHIHHMSRKENLATSQTWKILFTKVSDMMMNTPWETAWFINSPITGNTVHMCDIFYEL